MLDRLVSLWFIEGFRAGKNCVKRQVVYTLKLTKLTEWDDYFHVTFEESFFRSSWGSSENWLEPEILWPKANLTKLRLSKSKKEYSNTKWRFELILQRWDCSGSRRSRTYFYSRLQKRHFSNRYRCCNAAHFSVCAHI